MPGLPAGTVTFLITDMVGYTPLAEEQPGLAATLVERCNAIAAQAITGQGGVVFDTAGDSVLAAFETASAALAAALALQRGLAVARWEGADPPRVRVMLHTDTAEPRGGRYLGAAVNRAVRLMATSHGGQILLSGTTAELVRQGPMGSIELRDLGEHRIKQLLASYRLFQVIAPGLPSEFPPLQTQTAYEEIEEQSRHKSEFLASMSHELRTPLNAIIGFSEVLLARIAGELTAKQEEYIEDILSSGQHLLSLINDVLDLSKVEAGRMGLDLSTFSLPELLEDGITIVRERATRHAITLDLRVEPAIGAIEADERKLKQILLNLLSNAVKFTPDGGHIAVVAARRDGAVEVSVRDTGIGIPPDEQSHIFEQFRQAGGAATAQEGTGLGLALARRLVELHGGRIWLESRPGAGSTFAFSIPQPAAAALED